MPQNTGVVTFSSKMLVNLYIAEKVEASNVPAFSSIMWLYSLMFDKKYYYEIWYTKFCLLIFFSCLYDPKWGNVVGAATQSKICLQHGYITNLNIAFRKDVASEELLKRLKESGDAKSTKNAKRKNNESAV